MAGNAALRFPPLLEIIILELSFVISDNIRMSFRAQVRNLAERRRAQGSRRTVKIFYLAFSPAPCALRLVPCFY